MAPTAERADPRFGEHRAGRRCLRAAGRRFLRSSRPRSTRRRLKQRRAPPAATRRSPARWRSGRARRRATSRSAASGCAGDRRRSDPRAAATNGSTSPRISPRRARSFGRCAAGRHTLATAAVRGRGRRARCGMRSSAPELTMRPVQRCRSSTPISPPRATRCSARSAPIGWRAEACSCSRGSTATTSRSSGLPLIELLGFLRERGAIVT